MPHTDMPQRDLPAAYDELEQENIRLRDELEKYDEPVDPDFTPIPPEPDGSVHIAQLDLFCGILNHITKRHPGLMVDQVQVNEIIRAADIIVAAYAKPTKEVPCVPPAATQSSE